MTTAMIPAQETQDAKKRRGWQIIRTLDRTYPDRRLALNFTTPLELLSGSMQLYNVSTGEPWGLALFENSFSIVRQYISRSIKIQSVIQWLLTCLQQSTTLEKSC